MALSVIYTPACVYPEYKQTEVTVIRLKEEDAYPAQPQDAYGWEKLVTERVCVHYREDYGIETSIVRFHNIFGPLGTWEGGREKAPGRDSDNTRLRQVLGWEPETSSGNHCRRRECIAVSLRGCR